MSDDKSSICLNCIYGSQPYGYYPIVCVHGKRSRDMYHDKTKCKHFEACPEETTSLIRRYSNGYEAHWIDSHPHGEIYRDVHNRLGIVAIPNEQIMLLNSSGVVVVFLESITDLDRVQEELHLQQPSNRNSIFATQGN